MIYVLGYNRTKLFTSQVALLGESSCYSDPEVVMELGARVCYASLDKMGTNRGFLKKIVEMSHLDVVEHGYMNVNFEASGLTTLLALYQMVNQHPYLHLTEDLDGQYTLSANARVWKEFLESPTGLVSTRERLVKSLIEHVRIYAIESFPALLEPTPRFHSRTYQGGLRIDGNVQLIAACHADASHDYASHFTVLLKDVSRTMTHQLVRHRRMSFSQQSQRYVGELKGMFRPVAPPNATFETKKSIGENWMDSLATYQKLRMTNVLKEDARYVLPGSASSEILVSGDLAAWRHFFWLRALDSAAQAEIRVVGQRILRLAHEVFPGAFHSEMEQLTNMGAT